MIQVPQFLLDHMWGKGEACKIVCTQPRRISATSGVHYFLSMQSFGYYYFSNILFSPHFVRYKILWSWWFLCPVADRISYERGENVGDDVGYKVQSITILDD